MLVLDEKVINFKNLVELLKEKKIIRISTSSALFRRGDDEDWIMCDMGCRSFYILTENELISELRNRYIHMSSVKISPILARDEELNVYKIVRC